MTSFTFNAGIPDAPNNPSVDQPDMKQNNQSTNLILAVDHVSFNSTGVGGPGSSGGQHLQVTFNGKNVPGGAPTDPLSIMFTNNPAPSATNTAPASTVSQVFLQNQNAIFPMNLIRAYGSFDTNGNSLNTYNCSSSAFSSPGYTITLATGAIVGTSYGVLLTPQVSGLSTLTSGAYQINLPSGATFGVVFRTSSGAIIQPTLGFTVVVFQL